MKRKKKPLSYAERQKQLPKKVPRKVRRMASDEDEAQSALVQLATEIRKIYVRERSEYESLKCGQTVVWKPAKRYDGRAPIETDDGIVLQKGTVSAWLKLAKFFAEHRIEPRAYIQSQFEATAHRDRALNPDQLTSPAAQFRWRKAKRKKEEYIKLALTLQSSLASAEIQLLQHYAGKSPEDAAAVVLCNNGLELSALFRYCLARSIRGKRFRQIARSFEVEACLQFERFRTYYLRHWKSVLPDGFSKRSREIYEFLLWEPQNDGKEDEEMEA